mgnify:FL=1
MNLALYQADGKGNRPLPTASPEYQSCLEHLAGLESWLDTGVQPENMMGESDERIAQLERNEDYSEALVELQHECKIVREQLWGLMPAPPLDPHLEPGPSWLGNAGLGLFTLSNIKAGTDVCSYIGQEHTFKSSQRLKDKSYLNRVTDNLFVDPLPCPLVKARFINDPINPKAWNVKFVSDPANRRIKVEAVRDIDRGEELFVSYGEVYWSQQDISPTRITNEVLDRKRKESRQAHQRKDSR